MKKQIFSLFLFVLSATIAIGQTKIHSHNDYTHKIPFLNAVKNKAFSIEVDVFAVGDSLFVAHSRKEIRIGNTLEELYLKPIERLYNSKGFYNFQLMIDVKDRWEMAYPILLKLLKPYQKTFLSGKKKITIAVSGTRPDHSSFHNYPAFIMFDGLPNVDYAFEDLKKVTMISDNFSSYSGWNGVGEILETDKQKLNTLVNNAHKMGKPFRFWGAPDTEACWSLLQDIGADIINTDRVSAATAFLETQILLK